MFRNLRFYRVTSPWPETEEALSKTLEERRFKPCGTWSERSAGWEHPGNQAGGSLCRRLAGADLLELRTQSRILPSAAIKEALQDRVDEYRQRMGQEPPKREIRKLKEETRDELLPKALVKSDRVRGAFIRAESLLVVDAGTIARAEWFVEHLRPCFDGFRCEPLAFNRPPGALIQSMFLGKLPEGFSLGTECRMQDPSDGRATGTWRNVPLDDETIRRHVRDGMRLTHLGFGFDEMASGVLSDEAVITKFKWIEGDGPDLTDDEDPLARQDAEFVLLTGTVQRLVKQLCGLLDGYDDTPANPAQTA